MKDKRFSDFMCSCDEKGEKECEDTYEAVKRELGIENDKYFLDTVVYRLTWGLNNGQAYIIGIPCDMWSAIDIEYTYNFVEYDFDNCEACNDEEREDEPDCEHGFKTQIFDISCDRIHHGLARAYQLVKAFDETLS